MPYHGQLRSPTRGDPATERPLEKVTPARHQNDGKEEHRAKAPPAVPLRLVQDPGGFQDQSPDTQSRRCLLSWRSAKWAQHLCASLRRRNSVSFCVLSEYRPRRIKLILGVLRVCIQSGHPGFSESPGGTGAMA